jgi:hypothetical protein
VSAAYGSAARVELLAVALDGSDLRCLSCEAEARGDEPLLKAIPFADGRRILVRVGEQSPVRPADHGILECTPSVAGCRSAELVPLAPPSADDPLVTQDQREVRVAPDGETVALSQVRRTADGEAGFVAIVGRLRRTGDAYQVDDARAVSALGELKDFTPDGQGVLVAAFTTLRERAANPDIVRVDLASGDETRLTVDPDYDEDVDLSPDQRWYVVASGRGAHLFETVSQVKRPNFIGPGLEPLTAYLFVEHRAELLEPWLVEVGAEQRGERGQPVNPDSPAEGFDARVPMRWHPDGDRLVFWEGSSDPHAPAAGTTRIVVAHLTDRAPAPPPSPSPSPDPTWAPDLAGYQPPTIEVTPSRDGEVSGSVTVIERPGPGPGQTTVEVTYDDFSDDGEWVLDGTESAVRSGGLLGDTHYLAHLTVTGDHDGFLRADAEISAAGMTGSITSEVDGNRLQLPR